MLYPLSYMPLSGWFILALVEDEWGRKGQGEKAKGQG
jgi:hypothetical protein